MAILFDPGSAKWINLGLDLPLLRNVSGYSLMAWIKPEIVVAQQVIIAVAIGPPPGTSGSSRASIEIDGGGGITVFVRCADGDTAFTASAGAAVVNVWQHVGFSFDCNSKGGVIYINGVSAGTFTATGLTGIVTSDTNSKNAAIGSQDDGSSAFFDGDIEDARVYGRFVGAAEFATIYSAFGKDGIVADLQGRWPMNELGQGEAAIAVIDISENKIFGTPTSPTAAPVYSAGLTIGRSRRPWIE